MAESDKRMRAALKKVLVPALRERGFTGKYPEFQRKVDKTLHLVSVQFWKYGGSFLVECAHHPAGEKSTSWGEIVPEDKITVAHTPVHDRARLQHSRDGGDPGKDWFVYASFGTDDSKYLALAERVLELFSQVETWFSAGTAGNNLNRYGQA